MKRERIGRGIAKIDGEEEEEVVDGGGGGAVVAMVCGSYVASSRALGVGGGRRREAMTRWGKSWRWSFERELGPFAHEVKAGKSR